MPICRNVQALEAYTPGEQPKAADVIKLNTNENPYPPSPKVAEAIRAFDPARLRLYPDPVFRALREKIAGIHGCTPEQVFIGNGSDEVLSLCTKAFAEVAADDGTIGYFDPSYSLYPVLADIRDARRRPVPLGPGFAWHTPTDDAASLFFLTNPNAPTSLRYGKAEVAAFCRRFKGVVVIDEAYADFADETCMDLATDPANINTLVSRTLSKSFSLAGIRFGYLIGPADLIGAIYKIKDSYNMDMLTQVIGLAALSDLPYMRANAQRIRATRTRITGELRKRGWLVCDSQTNFLFARPPDGNAAAIFEALKAAHIYVRYFPGPLTGEYLRISIGTDEQMDTLLSRLER
ncbi:MAG: histidinol-phosphate transaminase [Kiritimatiellae bacterium]|nr:histidinol-phosphate transaminase [Kiritimatiellia bacterium]